MPTTPVIMIPSMFMRFSSFILLLAALPVAAREIPIRALLVCGGCCHDYEKQSVILRDGIQARANVQVYVVRSVDNGTKPWFPMYENKDWAAGYDVIIHDECAAGQTFEKSTSRTDASHS